ncbi:glycosyltransferase family 2 protein [Pseudooceanicola aestuarii]|uniref:glycosyltransferase family 2 protein n=1 Tax=Pseudooceanicola aestuarii TaxID=2697319 RepID=UPI0013D7251C|nr:glycosyltransferase [Pseudooceanicola aestuarii]
MPRISIIMPTYNAAAFVAETVQSVLGQSFGDFEFLAVDSASTDGTVEILRGTGDPRLEVIALPFVCEAPIKRNLGFARARGDYVALVDADDIMMPDRLARQLAFLEANPQVHVLGSSYITFEAGQPDKPVIQPAEDGLIKAHFLSVAGNAIHSPTVMMRRDFQQAHSLNFRVVRMGEGHRFWNDCMVAGARFANITDPLLRYRKHGGSHVRQRQEAYRTGATPIREELLTLFFPHLTRAEARLVARLMERGREHEISELATGITVIEKITEFRNCAMGADRGRVLRILGQAHGRARDQLRRALGGGAGAGREDGRGDGAGQGGAGGQA